MHEIERKFLVRNTSYINMLRNSQNPKKIKQGYIDVALGKPFFDGEINFEVDIARIRMVEENQSKKAYLTLKSKNDGIIRRELEQEIDWEKALELLPVDIIEKDRFEIKGPDRKIWEIDVFKGENQGLIIAEIELQSEDEHFEKIFIAEEEVSNDVRYFNNNLLEIPYTLWVKMPETKEEFEERFGKSNSEKKEVSQCGKLINN